jgi:hypothetical protein
MIQGRQRKSLNGIGFPKPWDYSKDVSESSPRDNVRGYCLIGGLLEDTGNTGRMNRYLRTLSGPFWEQRMLVMVVLERIVRMDRRYLKLQTALLE